LEKKVKRNLKKITDKTVQELLENEIILPSSYFELFDKNAKSLSIDIKDSQFEREISHVIADELKNINAYMKKAIKQIDILSDVTQEAQEAIKDKDDSKLKTLTSSLVEMGNEIKALKDVIYIDALTKTFNRKWIYNHAIMENGTFEHAGFLLFVEVNDCAYLADKYGNVIADNVIIYIAKFLSEKFKKENIKCDIARYSNEQFLIFIKEDNFENITSFIKNARLELSNLTLKSKSGLTFKTNFNFGMVKYISSEYFQQAVEKAAALSSKDKVKIKM
jgi:diguanylate cyclase (GGDEF)-like protein